jgi:6-phosphofructokinase 1
LQIAQIAKKVYGAKNGIEGVLKEQFLELNQLSKDSDQLEILSLTPSSALGTCRFRLQDWQIEEETYQTIISIFKKYNICYFIYIGGNDSMDTVNKLSQYCRKKHYNISVIGAPKTIDNDLTMTDHSPGFGSAAKYIATTVAELERDISSYDIPAVTIVEIMGRNAGWLTAAAALSRLNGGVEPT